MLFRMKNRIFGRHSASKQPTGIVNGANDAVHRWQMVLEQNPTDVAAALNLIAASAAINDEKTELELLSSVETSFPTDDEITLAIARHHLSVGRVEVAKTKWNAILETNSKSTEALNALGYVHLKMDNPIATLECADKLDEFVNTEKMSSKLRAHAFLQMKDWEKAVAHCEALVAINPDDTDVASLLITAYSKCERYDVAYKLFCNTYPSDVRDPKKLLTKQQLLMNLNDWDGSLAVNGELLQLKSDDRDVLYDRAIILLKLGQLEESDKICLKILGKNPRDLKFTKLSAQIGQAFVSAMKVA